MNLYNSDLFESRHLGLNDNDEKIMLNKLGFNSIENFLTQVVPKDIQINNQAKSNIPIGCSEREASTKINKLANQNEFKRSLIGLGYYSTYTPEVIKRHILENPRWYTSYTPYQAEISQGRLEALFNFQTLICELTGFSIANASLLDEGTAAAEAMTVAYAARKNKSSNIFLVSESVYNHTFNVLSTRAKPLGITIKTFNKNDCDFDDLAFGLLIQLPSQNGDLFNPSFLISKAHKKDISVCASIDPLAQVLIQPIAQFGVEIAIGSMQRFGVPVGFGGPHAAFFACSDRFRRLIPGRIVGETISKDGEKSLRLALQTREQHIRREKATSNICTSQSLLAIISSFYAVYHGSEGLYNIARKIVILRTYLEQGLRKLGFIINQDVKFDSFDVSSPKSVDIHKSALENGFNLRILPLGAEIDNATGFGISLDELSDIDEIHQILNIIADVIDKNIDFNEIPKENLFNLNGIPLRQEKFLQQNVFEEYRSETDLMRYIFSLAEKDFSLVDGMIPLGSCTMKLNAAAELNPISWKNFSAIHPFVPRSQVAGYE